MATSTSVSHVHMDCVCGVSPSGMCSGASWIRMICLSAKPERLCMMRIEFLA